MEATVKNVLPEIKTLLQKHEVESAYLFGSAAKETATEQSDVDFLIRFKSGLDYKTYGDNYFKLLYSLQELLNKDVDLVAEETLSNPYFIESINRSKVQLL
jgi:predicted nucleotidyltransferase